MKRCPRVRLPDCSPRTVPGTAFLPWSITRPCTGRTNCASPAPQRITFGIGSAFSASSTMPASTFSSARPLTWTRATMTSPFSVARFCSASTAMPCFFANPAMACGAALASGPATSVSRSWPSASTLAIETARRRGVANARASFDCTSCAFASSPTKASPNAFAMTRSDFGGSSSVSSSTSSVSGMGHREAEPLARFVVGLRDGARQGAHAADVGGALGDRDRAARVEQVEGVRGLQHHFIAGQHALSFDEALRLAFEVAEMAEQHFGIGELEVVARLLDLVLVIDVAVGDPGRPDQIEHALLALQDHRKTFQAVGDLAQHRLAGEAADFLKIRELRDFHAIEPDFPAQAAGAERRRFPVVLDEADVVLLRVDAQVLQRLQVEILDVRRRGLQHHLVLIVVLQAVGILSIAAILGASRRLHVRCLPRLGADRAQESAGVEGAGTDFHVVRLQQRASLAIPECIEFQDELLEGKHYLRRILPMIVHVTSSATQSARIGQSASHA